jgi:hypothetical protein
MTTTVLGWRVTIHFSIVALELDERLDDLEREHFR